MARQKLNINKDTLQRIVNQLEATQTFQNPSYLWKAIESTEWAKNLDPRPLTANVAYLRAKELGIIFNTKAGKRGGTMTKERVAKMQSGRKGRPRSIKMTVFASTFSEMRATYPSAFLPLISRAEKGSLKAALNLKCLECCSFQRVEVRNCQCPGCALYPHRSGAAELSNLTKVSVLPEEPILPEDILSEFVLPEESTLPELSEEEIARIQAELDAIAA